MRRFQFFALSFAITLIFSAPVYAANAWNVRAEISRLRAEVPPLEAFSGADAAVWLDSDKYSLTSDGGSVRESIFLMLVSPGAAERGLKPRRIPYPVDETSSVKITEAAIYDPDDGDRIGALPVREYDEGGIRGAEISFPREAEGAIAAITVEEISREEYRLSGVKIFSGELPVWEQTVTVEAADGMNVYWEGSGVGAPERVANGRIQRIKWTVLNEPAWAGGGILGEGRPALVFSLEHGLLAGLKKNRELEQAPYAPRIPPNVASAKSSLTRAAENIFKFMSPRLIKNADAPRRDESVPADGPWTAREQVMIAAKWLSAMGFETRVYWRQKTPVGSDGPSSPDNWLEPALKASGGGHEIYFKAGQTGDPEKIHPSLYGESLYRAGPSGVERITLPSGSAADHVFTQNWKYSLDTEGKISGKLDVTLTGGWIDVMTPGAAESPESAAGEFLKNMSFSAPVITFAAKSVKAAASGLRISYDVSAVTGIVSGGDILFKLAGGLPVCFNDIPAGGAKFSFRFPFVFTITSVVSTPKGYKAISLPGKSARGDSKALLEESVVHWPKRARAEAECKWTVRASPADEYASARIAEGLAALFAWPETAIPLRK
jgi:hypothetical protein